MIPGCSHNDTQSVLAALREAASLLAAGRRAEAAAAYRRVLALAPGNADALYGLGILAYHAGRHADAAALFGQTLVQQPENAGACNNRGLALAALGRLEAALRATIGPSRCSQRPRTRSPTAAMRCANWAGRMRRWRALTGRSRRAPTMPRPGAIAAAC